MYVAGDDHGTNGHTPMDQSDQSPTEQTIKTKKIKVTYEEYRTISNLIILHIRQQEESDKGMNDSHTNWHILHPQSLVACDRVSWSTGI